MPGAKQHFVAAACVGLAASVLKQTLQRQFDPARQFDWAELAAFGVAGGLIGLVPDLIEPAVTPDHRGFFHSVSFGAGLWYATHGPHSRRWEGDSRVAARTLCWCYLSHLIGDAGTPKGVKLI